MNCLGDGSVRRSTRSFVALDAWKERLTLLDRPSGILAPDGDLGEGRSVGSAGQPDPAPDLLGDAGHRGRNKYRHQAYRLQSVAHHEVNVRTRLHLPGRVCFEVGVRGADEVEGRLERALGGELVPRARGVLDHALRSVLQG